MRDPRPACIEDRLRGARRILAVTGGKGGIGKSLVSTGLALTLARKGLRTGLLDLDLTGPSDHIFLGSKGEGFPEERFGVEPESVHGVRFLSLATFGKEHPVALRGVDLTNALLELLAITRWGELDHLVIDMPPGLGDIELDLLRLLQRAEYVVVSTPSLVVRETVRRTLGFLTRLRAPVAGVIENMRRDAQGRVRDLAAEFGAPYLGALPFDEAVEAAIGHPEQLVNTRFMRALADCVDRIAQQPGPGPG